MKLSDYTYDLPEKLIADHPPETRGASRLLVLHRNTGVIEDKKYFNIVDYLNAGDVLVLNDTKVIRARLKAYKQSGVERELVVLEKHSFDENWFCHRVLYRGKLSIGDKLTVGDAKLVVKNLEEGGIALIDSSRDLLELTKQYGEVPLPPYMHRSATAMDIERYQTVWAMTDGSVAAPTASLNMTKEIIEALEKKGVIVKYLTLHVGLGTFLPIRTDLVEEHHMHQEHFDIPKDTVMAIQDAKKLGTRVVALGTTVARTLEYSADLLQKVESDISGEADIFIYPGYKFKVVDGLITNYHAPKSTVLMLASAYAGWDNLLNAYKHAISEKYNFLSYGDSMLII